MTSKYDFDALTRIGPSSEFLALLTLIDTEQCSQRVLAGLGIPYRRKADAFLGNRVGPFADAFTFDAARLTRGGETEGGMLPKVESAWGPGRVAALQRPGAVATRPHAQLESGLVRVLQAY